MNRRKVADVNAMLCTKPLADELIQYNTTPWKYLDKLLDWKLSEDWYIWSHETYRRTESAYEHQANRPTANKHTY